MVVVVDDSNRENEGDLVMAAKFVTREAINFMAAHGRGLICVPMLRKRIDELDIPPWSRAALTPTAPRFMSASICANRRRNLCQRAGERDPRAGRSLVGCR
jgi:3,4-dihydroxy-2-butanone 4-phosphate synthase